METVHLTGIDRPKHVLAAPEGVGGWLAELGVPPAPVEALPVNEIAPGVPVEGPVPGLDEEVHELHRRRFGQGSAS